MHSPILLTPISRSCFWTLGNEKSRSGLVMRIYPVDVCAPRRVFSGLPLIASSALWRALFPAEQVIYFLCPAILGGLAVYLANSFAISATVVMGTTSSPDVSF
jgi:hypothetical protein